MTRNEIFEELDEVEHYICEGLAGLSHRYDSGELSLDQCIEILLDLSSNIDNIIDRLGGCEEEEM